MNLKRKKLLTKISIGIFFFLAGVEYGELFVYICFEILYGGECSAGVHVYKPQTEVNLKVVRCHSGDFVFSTGVTFALNSVFSVKEIVYHLCFRCAVQNTCISYATVCSR
jgi:hypothetical protein